MTATHPVKALAAAVAKEAAKQGAKRMAARARERALTNIVRSREMFTAANQENIKTASTFPEKTDRCAKHLIAQGKITVPDKVLARSEQRNQQTLEREESPALASRREAAIEKLMDAPYLDEALARIKTLSDAPTSKDECNDLRERLREAVATGNINKETFHFYSEALKKLDIALTKERLAKAADPDTPADILATLATDEDAEIRKAVAGNPNTLPATLTTLAALATRNPEIRYTVARNPKTPPHTLITLADDRRKEVRYAVARNPKTPPGTSAILAVEVNINFRKALARDLDTLTDALADMADDENAKVRVAVAMNLETPPTRLALLATDDDNDVRFTVAMNPKTPGEALALLAAKKEDEDIREVVAGNPSLPGGTLAWLATDKNQKIRLEVAHNTSTPPETLAELAADEDEDEDVRRAAAENPKTPAPRENAAAPAT